MCGSLLLLGEATLIFSLDGFVAPGLVVEYMADMAYADDTRT